MTPALDSLQSGPHHKEYSLSSRAPPAVTHDNLRELEREAERNGVPDANLAASFSGRDDYVYQRNDSLQRRDFGKFVQFFRMSSSYIAGHRSNLFVISLPGEVYLKLLSHSIVGARNADNECIALN